jgi:hypothetical protein
MSSVIRKISIGSDYKNDAMHYAVGQQVYGGHEVNRFMEVMKYLIYFIMNLMTLTVFTSRKTTRYCHGRSLILTWLYLLSMI